MYIFLVYIHVVSAILSIGPFFVLLPLIKKLRIAQPEAEQAYLGTFKYVVTVVKHAGHVLVASGILLIIVGSWPWTTSWIVMTVLIMVSSVVFLSRAFSPTLAKFDNPQKNKAQLASKLRRDVWVYIALLMLMLWFMVAKPIYW